MKHIQKPHEVPYVPFCALLSQTCHWKVLKMPWVEEETIYLFNFQFSKVVYCFHGRYPLSSKIIWKIWCMTKANWIGTTLVKVGRVVDLQVVSMSYIENYLLPLDKHTPGLHSKRFILFVCFAPLFLYRNVCTLKGLGPMVEWIGCIMSILLWCSIYPKL